MLRPTFRSLFVCSLAILGNSSAFDSAVFAQIVPDQSTATEVRGNAIAPVGAGTVNGSNLYNSFDKFNVPNSGVVFNTGNSSVDGSKINNIINRVTGDTPSQILGTIESRVAFPNANLFLMNPNGVVFGKDARLDIGGSFNVSTGTSLGFAGDRKFSVDKAALDFPSGNPQNIQFAVSQPAAIINQGNLSVDAGKSISFTAGAIVNSGVLTAPSGNVALTSVAGGSVVDLRSPELVLGLSVVKNAVPSDWNGSITTLPKLAELLTGKAQQGDRVVVKPDGSLAIVVSPASNDVPVTNGTTVVSGVINVSSVNTDGGKVGIFGDRVAVVNSLISATGINGGTVLIGGDLQGKGIVPNAQFTYFDNKSVVDVSALQNGNGGKAIVWGDITTQFLGSILSKGGSLIGDGGFVEVSGKENLLYRGNVDTSAINGNFGTLLLDPTNITIVATGAADNIQLSAGVPTAGDPAFAIFFNDLSTNNFTIDNTVLNAATSNIILQARNDINVNAPVSVAAANISFTAQAGNNINVNQNITTNRGNISLLANNGATATGIGSVIFAGNNIATNGGNFTASGFGLSRTGSISINTSSTTGGNSGNIDVNVTGAINVDSSLLFTGINSGFTGNSGSITLTALGNIQASALQAAEAVGGTVINGGNVTVDAGGNITIGTLGSIATRSTLGGKAGDVLIKSGGSITALGTTGINTSVIGSSVGGSQAGNVTFQAGTTINTDAAIATSINSNTVTGNAGNITFTAGGNISATGDLLPVNLGVGNAGKVDITSNNDSITLGNVAVGSIFANSGNVTLKALNNITANYILSLGNTKGGDISLTSTNGSTQILLTVPNSLSGITLAPCNGYTICSAATNGTGGNINISGGGNFNIVNSSNLFTNGGNITIAAGSITTSSALITLNSISTTGGGTIDITATGDINVPVNVQFNNYVGTGGTGNSGDVFIKSTNGNITLGNINAGLSNFGSSRSINLNAAGNITFQGFQSSTSVGNSANLSVTAGNNITSTGQFIFTSALGTTGNSGNVQFTSTSGNITAGNIVAGISALNSSGNTGNITISASGNIQLATADSGISESTATGSTGKISITSGNGTINAGNVTSGVVVGNSNGNDTTISAKGAVTLLNVGTGSILGTGSGGNLVITGDSISAGALGAGSTGGASGKIKLTANNNISADFLLNLGKTGGGDVSITSTNGTISINSTVPNDGNLVPCVGSSICTAVTGGSSITGGNITINGNFTNNAGAVIFLANQNIITGNIATRGNPITLTSNTGLINTSAGTLNSSGVGFNGNGGAVKLQALGNITTASISSVAGGSDGGLISLISSGAIDTSLGSLLSKSTNNGNGGNIIYQAVGNITTGSVSSGDFGFGGSISLTTTTGNIKTGSILSNLNNLNGNGALTLTATNGSIDTLLGSITTTGATFLANQNIVVGNITTGGNPITLTSNAGLINTSAGTLNSSGVGFNGNGGAVKLQALGNITTASISSVAGGSDGGLISLISSGAIDTSLGSLLSKTTNNGNGGNIIYQAVGNITTGSVSSGDFGFGGSISLTTTTGNIKTGNILSNLNIININEAVSLNATNGSIDTLLGSVTGAGVKFLANQNIFTSNITTSGNPITLTSNAGLINTLAGTLDSSRLGANGNGGAIQLQALGNITTASISSAAANNDGGLISLISSNGAIDTSLGSLLSKSNSNGSGGNITYQAVGNITTGSVSSGDFGFGGSISLTTTTGNIKTGSILSNLNNLNGNGALTLTATNGSIDTLLGSITTTGATFLANQNIVVGNITTGGNPITLTSNAGLINTSAGTLNSSGVGFNGNGGAVKLQALGNITTASISSVAGGSDGGLISLISSGAIDTSLGSLLSKTTNNGNGGNIIYQAVGNITTGSVSSGDFGFGGSISLTTTTGNIKTGNILSNLNIININEAVSLNATNGSIDTLLGSVTGAGVKFLANQNIFTSNITTSGNPITLTSNAGLINTLAGTLDSSRLGANGNGGAIQLQALGNITTASISSAAANNDGGLISLISSNGAIDTSLGSLLSKSNSNGSGGNITYQAVGNITTGSVSSGDFGFGGRITLTNTLGNIKTGNISSNINGNGGEIFLTSTSGAIDLQNAIIDNRQNLVIKTDTGAVTLGSIGQTIPIVSLTVNAGSILANQAIAANSISFTTTGNITVNKIQSNLLTTNSGDIILNSGGALFLNGNLDTSSTSGTSGLISLTAARDIFANGAIILDGRVLGGNDSKAITVISQNGNITGSGLLDVFTSARNAGNVTFQAANSVLFRDIKTDGSSGTGGNVTITATTGNITGNSVFAISQGSSTGSGNVTLTAGGDIAIKQINSNTQNGKAGDITVKTALSRGINGLTSIQANSITGQGGNITLESGSTLPNAGLNILAGGAIAGSTIDLRTASLLIGGNLIIDSANSDILLGETSVQPFNFEIRNARNVTFSQRLVAEKVDITNTGILKFTDANTLITAPTFQQQNASEVQLTGEIRGTTIIFNSPVVLTGNAILTASDSGLTQGAIAFNSTLKGGGRDLKLSTNEIDFGNNVSGINALTLAPSSATVNIQLGGTTNVAGTFTLTETDLINVQAGGLGSLIIGGDFGAQISIVSPIPTFLQKTIIQADGFGSTGLISQGSIIASAPVSANGSDTISFIASQNVNINDVTNTGKDIIVTSTNANVITGNLTTTSTSAASGNVIVTASKGSVSVNSIVTQSANDKAGDITIQAANGIQIDKATADSTSTGNSGSIFIASTNGDIQAYDLSSSAVNSGGQISVSSSNGNIAVGEVTTFSSNGKAGDITIQSQGNFSFLVRKPPNAPLGTITAVVGTNNGNISIISNTGSIDAYGGGTAISSSYSSIFANGNDSSGSINIQAPNGNVTFDGLYTLTTTDTAGNVSVQARGDINIISVIQTGSRSGNAGSISVTSTNGSILASNPADPGFIEATSTNGNSGNITFTAPRNITVDDLQAQTTTGNAGNISLNAGGAIQFGSINSRIRQTGLGKAGDINLQAVGNITSTSSTNIDGQDYAIVVANFSNGNGGNVSLTSTNGSINVSSGQINTATSNGTAGSVNFKAAGDIITGAGTTPNPAVATFINTGGTGTPNSITFTSSNGAINTSAGDIDAGGGAITFTARNNITTSGVFSRALNGGSINLESKSGAINTTAGDLTTSTDPLSIISTGTGGTINLLARGNITTSGVFATGSNGNITIESQNAGINTSLNDLASSGSNTNITLKAPQDIVTRSIFAQGDGSNITISSGGNVDLSAGFIQTGIDASQTGSGGALIIKSAGNILAGTLNTPNLSSTLGNAGSVSLTSDTGAIAFTGISARRANGDGNGGAINIQANGNITSTGVASLAGAPSIYSLISGVFGRFSGNGGAITLTSTTGSIDTRSGAIGTSSQIGDGGNISLGSPLGTITTGGIEATGNISGSSTLLARDAIAVFGDINTSSNISNGGLISLTSRTGAVSVTGNLTTSATGAAGKVIVDALTQIDVGKVNTSSSFGNGGDVILDPIGNVTFTSINSTGNTTVGGSGGNINIVSTGGNVLGTGVVTFATGDPCVGATICTNGVGTVSIQHGITSPFDLNTFLVGSATTNGTLGTIIAGGSTILSFQGIPNGAGFFTQGNVSITPGGGIFIPPSIPIPPSAPIPPSIPLSPTPTSTPTGNGTFINPIIITSTPPVVVAGSRPPAVDINDIAKRSAGEYLALGRFEDAFNEMEKGKISEFENYLGETLTFQVKTLEQIQQELDDISNRSGSITTVVYPIILSDRLELLIIPPKGKGKPFREFVNAAKESAISPVIQDFANNIRDVASQDYLEQSQKLYDWLVRPYSDRLATINSNAKPDTQLNPKQNAKPNISDKLVPSNAEAPQEKLPPTLVFVMDGGLRVIPIAALHDGKQFLIEKYALANLPYLRVTRLETRDRRLNNVLAMGLTESVQGFSALPSVKVEVSTISSQVLGGDSYLDKDFTIENLQSKRRQGNFAVLHLATHAKFLSNEAQGAFIQFWNERLSIDRIPSLRFDSPLIEMLTLSACQTAVGQNLGLGGLSVSSGAKSVLASLWEVSDTGTAPLMIQFYNSFPENITKAIALQRSQIEILQGKVTIKDGKIFGLPKLPTVPLSQVFAGEVDIKHPYFWSSFILIGNWL
ncbi:CHAT domain-containing protein [Pseudanabaena sp. FACHB-1998]|uniref:CHAT domain-containing protein n=1 Tax=Pseudanabaena sp. FACHB-1998 TaxID=2692858 RepID=UPI0016813047|nr:CHAT domain-containing protein [Pseudanabaena sp. FACHB-1998]MBD2176556.1 CHAT domain-containing protein [Pseudanabaena sp. FACHB-1998]